MKWDDRYVGFHRDDDPPLRGRDRKPGKIRVVTPREWLVGSLMFVGAVALLLWAAGGVAFR